jgi:hypothetical protein
VLVIPEETAQRITDLLWRMLSGEQLEGEDLLEVQKPVILTTITALDPNVATRLDRILLFYEPGFIAAAAIERSDCFHAEIAADNERLVALTSIVDFLANQEGLSRTAQRVTAWYSRCAKWLAERICGPLSFGGAGKGFAAFLRKYLTDNDFALVRDKHVLRRKGNPKRLERFGDITTFLYTVRSLVVHGAELGGIWPSDQQLTMDPTTGRLQRGVTTVPPRDFRLLLWRAILRSFGLDIVRW